MPKRPAKRKQRSAKEKAKEKGIPGAESWGSLTWDDLDCWAGSRSVTRGRAYQRQGRVKNLAITEDGRLLATVLGGDRYTVSVWRVPGKKRRISIESTCTCPVGYNGCKHAVAVVAAYLQSVADEAKVLTADTDDPRWAKLDHGDDGVDEFDMCEFDEYDDEQDDWRAEVEPTRGKKRGGASRTRKQWNEAIQEHIHSKSHEELADLVCSLVVRFPELREEFQERIALGEGDVDRLTAQARRELRELTSEPAWRNSWTGEGHTPDFDRLKHRLERLVELGHADAVVELGRDFIERALLQVEESHDEGETAMAAGDCMPVVFDAVKRSSLSVPEKVIFAVDACLKDPFDVVDDAVAVILDAKWAKADWSAVADALRRRLTETPEDGDHDFFRNYQRDRITDWLATALENAGRDDELLTLYETEARKTNSYQRLVAYLIAKRKYDEAQRWAEEGIEKTCEHSPGIASSLATELCELARRRRKWDVVAADAAWRFFDRPSAEAFEQLVDRAAKAKCAKAVRAAALHFLETGKAPVEHVTVARGKDKGKRKLRIDPAWPLSVPDYLLPLMRQAESVHAVQGPHFDVLLDMAIDAKKPDDVLRWYNEKLALDKRSTNRRGTCGWHGGWTADRVAAAVAKSHPERALEIYRQGLDSHLPHANLSSYESAAAYLKAMRPIMKSLKQAKQWNALLAEIREEYRRRPRFMEILDRLEGHTILATQKSQRRKRDI